jgi:molybdenum cofactor synthesis domain-containing protein
MDAWIISIGNEMLIGKVVNTNLSWLGRKLTLLGYRVRAALTVMDECEDIKWAFNTAKQMGASVIISTGGLGPTFDDMTSKCLSEAFNRNWVVNDKALEMVKKKYKEMGLDLTDHRIKMAKMPEGAEPLWNPVGTAPGIMMNLNGTLIFSLPGVPSEMMAIFEESIEPILRKLGPKIEFVEEEILSRGLPESTIAPIIERVMGKHRVYIKSHPQGKELGVPVQKIHIQSSSIDLNEARKELKYAKEDLIRELTRMGAEVEEVRS